MSAKAMDSNAELKFYLQAVTDPSRDIQSNLDAIDTLSKRFGSGASVPSFNSEEEAIKSGVKGNVIIGGRSARID